MRLAQPLEPPAAEAPQPQRRRQRLGERGARRRRQDDLPAVRAVTDARRGVDGEADVAGLGQRRAAAVDPRADADVDAVRPRACGHRALDLDRGRERGGRVLEHGEELVAARVDLVPAGLADRAAQHTPHGRDERRVAVVELREQLRRALDVGQQEGDVTLRQPPLRLELRADEPDRRHAVLLRRA